MHEFQMRSMKSDAVNERLRRFFPAIFSIADYGMAQRQKLRSNLILQSGYEFNPHQSRIRKKAFNRISEFSARGLGIFCRAQLLIHSFAPKIMRQRCLLNSDPPAHRCKVLPDGGMGEELPHQSLAIGRGLRKEQRAGGKTIDAMHDEGALLFPFQSIGEQRPCGGSLRTLDGHGQKAGGFVDYDYGIVFVKDGKLQRKTRAARVFSD